MHSKSAPESLLIFSVPMADNYAIIHSMAVCILPEPKPDLKELPVHQCNFNMNQSEEVLEHEGQNKISFSI